MGSRDFKPVDVFFQLESDMMRTMESAMRALKFQPCVDVYETETALHIEMELAGLSPDRLNITLSADDRQLVVSGERVEPKEEGSARLRCYQLEVYYGPFERAIGLPPNIRIDREQLGARYRDGFLVISLPKRKETVPARRTIEITNE